MIRVKVLVGLLVIGLVLSQLLGWTGVARAVSFNSLFRLQRDVLYSNVDGLPLKMDIYSPLYTPPPWPAVIYIHGGGWYSGEKTSGAGIEDIPELVDSGYLVASIDYRLAPRYQFPAQIEDVLGAVRFLRIYASQYDIDAGRIGMFGDSAGGHLAALAGVIGENSNLDTAHENPGPSARVQAVVDMFGPADLSLFYQRNYSLSIEHVFGTDDPLSPLIKRASPITYTSTDDPPFMIVQGDSDSVVQPEQSLILYRYLNAVNVPANLTIVNNCGHGFIGVGGPISPTRNDITRSMIGFFNSALKAGR